MDIQAQLKNSHSKENSLKIVQYIGDNPQLFDELMQCFFMQEEGYRVPQRAAHTVSLVFVKQPKLILPYRQKLIEYLGLPEPNSSLKRNILRVLQFTEIEKEWMGNLYSRCYEFLGNPKEEIAIRAFSMTVLYNISQNFPELKPELKTAMEMVLAEPRSSPGIQSRGRAVLKKLYKEIQ